MNNEKEIRRAARAFTRDLMDDPSKEEVEERVDILIKMIKSIQEHELQQSNSSREHNK